jgi:SPP1 family predicted phage head-tail adaptor
MSKRKVNRRPLTKSAIGDMREPIQLRKRTLTPAKYGEASATESYEVMACPFAKVVTKTPGQREFDKVNLGVDTTHIFTIRYFAAGTAETVVTWGGENYDVQWVEKLDGRKEFMNLHCKVLGDKTLEANQ